MRRHLPGICVVLIAALLVWVCARTPLPPRDLHGEFVAAQRRVDALDARTRWQRARLVADGATEQELHEFDLAAGDALARLWQQRERARLRWRRAGNP